MGTCHSILVPPLLRTTSRSLFLPINAPQPEIWTPIPSGLVTIVTPASSTRSALPGGKDSTITDDGISGSPVKRLICLANGGTRRSCGGLALDDAWPSDSGCGTGSGSAGIMVLPFLEQTRQVLEPTLDS